MKQERLKKQQRGIALITALLMCVVFLVLIGGLMSQVIAELDSVGAHSRSAQALNAAYSGVEDMTLAIEESASGAGHATPSPISYTYPAPSTVSYSATVTNSWNSNNGFVYYMISSTGTEDNSGQQRQVLALVESFPYTYYEQFTAGNSGSVFYTTGEHFDGPVYNGGTMNVWYQDPGTPIFNSSVQSTVTPSFYEGAGQTPVSFNNVTWSDVTGSQGASALTVQSNPMQLPTYLNNLTVASEAFYGNANHTANVPNPGSNGVYMNGVNAATGPGGALSTGIFIQGDVQITPCSGTCGSYSGNNEVFTLKATGSNPIPANYTVDINFSSNTTTVAQTTSCGGTCPSATYSGVPSGQTSYGTTAANGAIFVDGDVTLTGGSTSVIHGDYSIVVPDYSSNDSHTITLNGAAPGILYKDESSSSTDELGIWANDISVNSTSTTGYEFDGAILTGYYNEGSADGKFSNANYSGSVEGAFTFHGGLVQNINGPMGITSGGTLVHGFSRNYQYDARLAANPPPGFPITNRYDIVAWLDMGT